MNTWKISWFVFCSSSLENTIPQGTVKGTRRQGYEGEETRKQYQRVDRPELCRIPNSSRGQDEMERNYRHVIEDDRPGYGTNEVTLMQVNLKLGFFSALSVY